MTESNEEKSEIEAMEADPRLRGEFAAARLASTVGALMDAVVEACSAMNKDIAEAMGVSAGRVSQILGGDGNVRVATLARLLDACGYELELTARPKSGRGLPITLPRPHRRRRATRSTPALSTTTWTVFKGSTSDATARGFEFETVVGVGLITDSAHAAFPTIGDSAWKSKSDPRRGSFR